MNLFNQLKQQYYAHVPFVMDAHLLQQAIDAFFRFLEEPPAVKEHIDFKLVPNHRRAEVGYGRRIAEQHIYNDNKELFQFHPLLLSKYASFLDQNPVVAEFMQKAYPIWNLVYETIHRILMSFEDQFSGVTRKVFETEHPHILVRFLKYDWQSSGKYLAKPHFDSGSCTLAIAESDAGLRIGSCPDDLQVVEHKTNQAIFMLSSNYRQLLNTDTLSAGWHDVIQLDETQIGQPFARWAIVAFIEAQGVDALPRTETHKWYQPTSID